MQYKKLDGKNFFTKCQKIDCQKDQDGDRKALSQWLTVDG